MCLCECTTPITQKSRSYKVIVYTLEEGFYVHLKGNESLLDSPVHLLYASCGSWLCEEAIKVGIGRIRLDSF